MLSVRYLVQKVSFNRKFAEVHLKRDDTLQIGDPGYVGGMPARLRFTTTDFGMAASYVIDTPVDLAGMMVPAQVAPQAPAAVPAATIQAQPVPALPAPQDGATGPAISFGSAEAMVGRVFPNADGAGSRDGAEAAIPDVPVLVAAGK